MINVGIDVSQKKHDICIINSDGTILIGHLTIENNKQGFHALCNTIEKQEGGCVKDHVRIGLEDTGHYSINLLHFLRNQGYSVYTYNPMLVKEFAKSITLRKTKTDKKDANLIARKLMSDDRPERFNADKDLIDLKFLTRNRTRLGQYQSEAKVQYTRLIDLIFPELSVYATSVHHNYVYSLLKRYPSAKDMGDAHLTALTATLYSASQGKIGKKEAVELRELAKDSIGQSSRILELEMTQTIETIEFYSEKTKVVNKQVGSLMKNISSPITSVPGISDRLGSVIISEINNIDNFKSPSQLLAFAGMEPSINQSGRI